MVKVFLNVYDLIASESKAQGLSKDGLNLIGMGIHHSGIEVFGEEISFGGDSTGRNDPNEDGVFIVEPRSAVGHWKEQIELGEAPHLKTRADVEVILNKIRPKWRSASYHLLAHNCNCFSKAFAEAIDPALAKNIPSWVNRAGTGANVVVPDALLRNLTDAINPPTAFNSDLIGVLHQAYAGTVPAAIPNPNAEAAAASKPSGGLMGFAKGIASTVSGAVKGVVDDSDRKNFQKAFPSLKAELLDTYACRVIHINRVQRAKVYVTSAGLALDGTNQLNIVLPYKAYCSIQYAKKIKPPKDNANLPPTFEPIKPTAKGEPSSTADGLLLYGADGKSITPLFDFTSMGTIYETTMKVSGAGTPTAVKAMKMIDQEWRKNVRV